MLHRKGSGLFTRLVRVFIFFAAIILILLLINLFTGGSVETFLKGVASGESTMFTFNLKEVEFTSYSAILKNEKLSFLDYFFGKIPDPLIEKTGGVKAKGDYSAVIIMLAIWLFLFLTFSDIAVLFSTFRPYIGWIIGFVLTVMAANLKVTTYMAFIMMNVATFLGGYTIIGGVIILLLLYVLSGLGVEWVRKFFEERKKVEAELKKEIKEAKASMGRKIAEGMADAAVEE